MQDGSRPVELFFTKEEAVARAAELNAESSPYVSRLNTQEEPVAESPLITGDEIRKGVYDQSANTPEPVAATDPAFDEHGHYTGEWF